MKIFKRFILLVYNSFAYKVLKFILIKLFSEKGYNNLKNYIKKKIITTKNHPVAEKKYFKEIDKKYGVNISGFLSSGLGLGEAARNIVKSINTQHIDYVLNNQEINKIRRANNEFSENVTKDNPYFFNLINVNPDRFDFFYLKVKKYYFKDKYNIGIWYWELTTFPDEWIRYYNFFNEIWVATDFILNAISLRSPIPVVKIPPVIDLDYNKEIGRKYFNIPQDVFLYLFIFDFYSFIERKNPVAIIKSFKSVFEKNRDVMLILKTTNSKHFKKDFDRLINEIGDTSNIMIIDQYLDRVMLNSLINITDCYVSLHRSEGFGLGIAEAMYLGKPVIVTAYSGNMDFTNVNNSFLVKYGLIELKEDYGLYKKNNIWAEPDVEHAAQLMRFVFENRDYAYSIAKKGQEFIKQNYNAELIGKKIKQRFDFILSHF